MRLYNLTEPAVEPILIAEARDHLRIDGDSEDAYLGALIAAARIYGESWTGLTFINQQMKLTLDHWPRTSGRNGWWDGLADGVMDSLFGYSKSVALPVSPVSSIDNIQITESDESISSWTSDDWILIDGVDPSILLKDGAAWPKPGRSAAGIDITLTAGFGPDSNSVPAAIKQALLMIIARLYAARGDSPSEAMHTSGAAALLTPYRKVRL